MDWKLVTYDVNGYRFTAIDRNGDLVCPFAPVPGGCAHFVETECSEKIYCAYKGKTLDYCKCDCVMNMK